MQQAPIILETHDSSEISGLQKALEFGISPDSLALGLLEQSDDCIKILDVSGTIEHINCAGLQAMQIADFNQVRGQIWWELWPDHNRGLVRQTFMKCIGGKSASFIASCPTALGETRKWSVKLKPMISDDGRVAGILCTSRDVTSPGVDLAESKSPADQYPPDSLYGKTP